MEDINLGKFTQEEEAILRLTEEIWNRFLELPINHPMEKDEMAIKIHDIQRMIISRPGMLGLWLLCVLCGLWDNRGTP